MMRGEVVTIVIVMVWPLNALPSSTHAFRHIATPT